MNASGLQLIIGQTKSKIGGELKKKVEITTKKLYDFRNSLKVKHNNKNRRKK